MRTVPRRCRMGWIRPLSRKGSLYSARSFRDRKWSVRRRLSSYSLATTDIANKDVVDTLDSYAFDISPTKGETLNVENRVIYLSILQVTYGTYTFVYTNTAENNEKWRETVVLELSTDQYLVHYIFLLDPAAPLTNSNLAKMGMWSLGNLSFGKPMNWEIYMESTAPSKPRTRNAWVENQM